MDEVFDQYIKSWAKEINPKTEIEKAVRDNHVGTYGICIDDEPNYIRYIVAGNYQGGAVPKEMLKYSVPAMQWAKFKCTGPIPGAIQSVNTKIFKEWLPGNPDWDLQQVLILSGKVQKVILLTMIILLRFGSQSKNVN